MIGKEGIAVFESFVVSRLVKMCQVSSHIQDTWSLVRPLDPYADWDLEDLGYGACQSFESFGVGRVK